jgi:hypothetical protein
LSQVSTTESAFDGYGSANSEDSGDTDHATTSLGVERLLSSTPSPEHTIATQKVSGDGGAEDCKPHHTGGERLLSSSPAPITTISEQHIPDYTLQRCVLSG